MGKLWIALLAGAHLFFAPLPRAQGAIYVHVDAQGTAHFTDAPTKPYFQRLPAFGLPPGVDLVRGQYADLINGLASEHGVNPALVKAIILAESNFDQNAVSRKGAQGLMQLMPGTAGRYAVGNPFDPGENIRGGVQHLRALQEMFPGQLRLVLAAYNAGENAVLRHNGVPPYPETREYVTRVLKYFARRGDEANGAGARAAGPETRDTRPPQASSTPAIFRQMRADGVPFYTNVPPVVRSSRQSLR